MVGSIMSLSKSVKSKRLWPSTVACSTSNFEAKAIHGIHRAGRPVLRSRRAVHNPPTMGVTRLVVDNKEAARKDWSTRASSSCPGHFSTFSTLGHRIEIVGYDNIQSTKRRMCCAAWDSRSCRKPRPRSRSLATKAWRRNEPHAPARASIAWSSTFAPASRCSGRASSISLWLMPSLHGTKIIDVGATRAT